MGYLPAAMRNYLLRLGWSHGNDELISTAEAIEWFNFENVGRSPARFDFKKLDNLNAHYIRQSDDAALAEQVAALRARAEPGTALNERAKSRLAAAMPGLKERAKTLVELAQSAEFLFTDGKRNLDAAAEKLLTPEARAVLGEILPHLTLGDWTGPALEQAARNFADAKGLKLGQVAQPIRAAATGKAASPPIFEMLAVLGREESLIRLRAYAG